MNKVLSKISRSKQELKKLVNRECPECKKK